MALLNLVHESCRRVDLGVIALGGDEVYTAVRHRGDLENCALVRDISVHRETNS